MLKEGGRRLNVVPLEPVSRGIVTQHNPIVSDSSVAVCVCSVLRHGIVSVPGIISMPAILQAWSLRTRAVSTSTLPPTTNTRIRDESRFSIAKRTLGKSLHSNSAGQFHFPGPALSHCVLQALCRAEFACFW